MGGAWVPSSPSTFTQHLCCVKLSVRQWCYILCPPWSHDLVEDKTKETVHLSIVG